MIVTPDYLNLSELSNCYMMKYKQAVISQFCCEWQHFFYPRKSGAKSSLKKVRAECEGNSAHKWGKGRKLTLSGLFAWHMLETPK